MNAGVFFEAFNQLLGFAWNILKWPIYLALAVFFVMCLLYGFWYLYLRYHDKMEPISAEGKHYAVKEDNIFKKVLLALKQMAYDRLAMDPSDFYPKDGRIIAFCGRQGQGKTIAMTYLFNRYKAEWPMLKTATNYEYKYQDYEINHWKDMVDIENGKQGVMIGLDEGQLWFNSRDYRNLDVNFLSDLCFQRKQSKMLLISSQSFHFLDKSIRCQVQEIHQCYTFGRAFTVVIVKIPEMTYDGDVEKLKWKRMYCFNHDEYLRKSYDTYKRIQTLKDKGFVPRGEQLGHPTEVGDTNVVVDSKALKKKK